MLPTDYILHRATDRFHHLDKTDGLNYDTLRCQAENKNAHKARLAH
ncbi:hypothetical protein QUF64_14245 [Anaerolineales bacterium HSG6]|nr:hypothetical protein [Anaerolineales bacterium HSG6]